MTVTGPPDFEAAVLPHIDEAYNLAHWLMRNTSDAEDVLQEAMLRALIYFPSFRGSNARAWVLQIVRNAAYSALQKHKNTAALIVSLEQDAGTDNHDRIAGTTLCDSSSTPEAILLRVQECEKLDALLAELPVELRECLILFELNGVSYKEISAITETPIGTVMSRLWRARRMLIERAAGRPQ